MKDDRRHQPANAVSGRPRTPGTCNANTNPDKGAASSARWFRRSDALVSNLDVFPTLLGLCGLDDRAARGGQGWGRDLSDELRAGAPVPSAPFVTSSTDAMMAAKLPDGRKLIVPYPEQRSAWGFDIEWFDLETDPHELRPLPLDADAERLLERLRGFRQGGPFVRWSEQVLDEDTIGRLRELGYIR